MDDLHQACLDALGVVQRRSSAGADVGADADADADAAPPLDAVLADVDALLAHIRHLSTSLSLARHVPRDLVQHVHSLAHAVSLVHHGATLTKRLRIAVADVLQALRALVRALLADDPDYLRSTGALHDLVDQARSPTGIPRDNHTAVCLAWDSDRDSLQDNLHEAARLVDGPRDDDDDGWDELGLADATRLNDRELARAKNVHHVLRLTTLLHKRIFLDLLSYPSSAPPSAFDHLLLQSNRLLSTSDDLVAALYSPQDPDAISNQLRQISDIAASIKTQLPPFLTTIDDLATQLHPVTLKDGSPVSTPSQKRANKKWFDTCLDQILALCSRACT